MDKDGNPYEGEEEDDEDEPEGKPWRWTDYRMALYYRKYWKINV